MRNTITQYILKMFIVQFKSALINFSLIALFFLENICLNVVQPVVRWVYDIVNIGQAYDFVKLTGNKL